MSNLVVGTLKVTALVATAWWGISCEPAKKDQQTANEDTGPKTYSYNYQQPTARYDLPKALEEISGIAYHKPNQLLCVQDEAGKAFVFDMAKNEITGEHLFGPPDDYEDIVQVNDEIYVLRSDGKLFNFKWDDSETREIETDLPGKNDVEGLGYNPENNRLYLAVKEASKKLAPSDEKLIYSFDLKRRAVYQELKFTEKAFAKAGVEGKSWKDFKPSGVAIHPFTSQIYLLSSAGNRLLVLSRDGSPLQNIALDPAAFRQPEGICFDPNGTLYISSEGDGKKGYILAFESGK
jgi:uncharacterized protein YjiK